MNKRVSGVPAFLSVKQSTSGKAITTLEWATDKKQNSLTAEDDAKIRYAVSQVVGYIKGSSAIHIARVYGERKRNFVGQPGWARGYFVSTLGRGGRRRLHDVIQFHHIMVIKIQR